MPIEAEKLLENRIDPSAIRSLILARRAISFLAPYFDRIDARMDSEDMYLAGSLSYRGERLSLRIPLDKRLKIIMRELERMEPAIIGGRINIDDVKLAIFATFAPFLALKPFIQDVRRVTGLIKDGKLRKLLIFKRIISVRGKKAIRRKPKKDGGPIVRTSA